MSARDHYTLPLRRLICGRTGTASWSEREQLSLYTVIGRTLDAVSDGFTITQPKDGKGDSVAHCADCDVKA